jgi:hypothetical protein
MLEDLESSQETVLSQRVSPPYPNILRETREGKAMLSRAQVIRLCAQLQTQDDIKYVKVSMTTLHDLEAGLRRPRRSTALTLSVALDEPVGQLFPSGYDDPVRNPEGKTRIAPDRPAPGRPRSRRRVE